MAVNFYLESRTDKKGFAPIRVSVSIQGQRFVSSTGLKINPSKWDATKQQAKKGSDNFSVTNAFLLRMREHFTDYETQVITTGAKECGFS